jgi:serine/threonine protein kinase/tetratricopeptide (TPR) repeat protein
MNLTPGSQLGPYELVALIGRGGMGEVYRARDPRLGRDVAIKVLSDSGTGQADWLHRFKQEARAIAALSHPNILAIFDVGTGDLPFLVTELLDGETLRMRLDRGPLPMNEAASVAVQLVSGLAAAHERGVVHRDLKPANVFLTRDGIVKILDFGLAKAVAPGAASESPTCGNDTLAGMMLGTVGYMAPEQVRGETADVRSDIFAVGAVLYELVSGQRAFAGDSTADTMSAVLKEEPPDLALRGGIPAAFARIVRRCLDKDPRKRFQSASDLRFALEAAAGVPTAGQPVEKANEAAIAVLPFTNMSADPENQYFSDGLSEELINALTRLPGLRVASRTSAFRFRGGDVDIRQVGKDLQVSTVVEGSVRRAGSRLRVTAQLINVIDGYHLWSERYDREMADVFDIQDEIVEAIVKAVAPALVGDAKKGLRRPTENLEAYELYLKGRHHWHQRTPSAMQVAQRTLEQVIALDPEYALAHAGLADCFSVCRVYGWVSATHSRDRAKEAVTKAMALDPTLAEVNFAQAAYIFYFEPRWRRAEAFLRQAVAINPRFAGAHAYLGLVLATDERHAEAKAHAEIARQVDPLSAYAQYLAAVTYFVSRRFEEVERSARRALELQPDALAGLWVLGLGLTGLEQREESVAALERAVTLSRAPIYIGLLGLTLARAGHIDAAMRLVGELRDRADRGEYIAPFALLAIHVGLGDVASMRNTLKACIADATPYFDIRCTSGPFLDAYRNDPEISHLHNTLREGAESFDSW